MSLKNAQSLLDLLPDTPTIHSALSFVRKNLDDPSYNHVVRSALFSSILASKLLKEGAGSHLIPFDAEIIAVAGLLHDMAWNPRLASTRHFISKDKRFEVDGAIVASRFLSNLPKDHGWDTRRIQLVWDAIALHTTRSIGWFKEPEVAMTSYGIMMDIMAKPAISLPGVPESCNVSQQEFDEVYAEFPSLRLANYVKEALCALCMEKPETTFDNVVSGFGEVYVDGYSLQGKRMVDLLKSREILES